MFSSTMDKLNQMQILEPLFIFSGGLNNKHCNTERFKIWISKGPARPLENRVLASLDCLKYKYNFSFYLKRSKLAKSLVLQWSRPFEN